VAAPDSPKEWVLLQTRNMRFRAAKFSSRATPGSCKDIGPHAAMNGKTALIDPNFPTPLDCFRDSAAPTIAGSKRFLFALCICPK
jgi:hypothetical protein